MQTLGHLINYSLPLPPFAMLGELFQQTIRPCIIATTLSLRGQMLQVSKIFAPDCRNGPVIERKKSVQVSFQEKSVP